MSEQPDEFQADELLRMMGKVPVPGPSALEDAREILWSAIASEMLGIGTGGEEHRGRSRRLQPGQSDGERRRSMGGGGDPG